MATVEELETRLQAAEATIDQLKGTPLPQGAQVSFPVTGHQANMPEWMDIHKAFANGVLDYGGWPFRITDVDDANNSLRVNVESGTGEAFALLQGLGFRMSQAATLNIPGVSSPTLYTIALEFDPASEADPLNAIRLQVLTGQIPTTNKKHIRLWSGTRQPSTVLSQMVWTEHRQRIVPQITVDRERFLPTEEDGTLWGSEARVGDTGDVWVFRGNTGNMGWRNLTRPDWVTLPLARARVHAGPGEVPAVTNAAGITHLKGTVGRDGAIFTATGDTGWHLATLPEKYRPPRRVTVAVPTTSKGTIATLNILPDGQIHMDTPRDVWQVWLDASFPTW